MKKREEKKGEAKEKGSRKREDEEEATKAAAKAEEGREKPEAQERGEGGHYRTQADSNPKWTAARKVFAFISSPRSADGMKEQKGTLPSRYI